jgi:hypothetical protein
MTARLPNWLLKIAADRSACDSPPAFHAMADAARNAHPAGKDDYSWQTKNAKNLSNHSLPIHRACYRFVPDAARNVFHLLAANHDYSSPRESAIHLSLHFPHCELVPDAARCVPMTRS